MEHIADISVTFFRENQKSDISEQFLKFQYCQYHKVYFCQKEQRSTMQRFYLLHLYNLAFNLFTHFCDPRLRSLSRRVLLWGDPTIPQLKLNSRSPSFTRLSFCGIFWKRTTPLSASVSNILETHSLQNIFKTEQDSGKTSCLECSRITAYICVRCRNTKG